jgi:F-type H+-transporting ATPase subunit gamma
MASVLDLRRRIRSVKNTRQITKAMKMVSAARLRRAQERAVNSRAYAQMLAAVLKSLVERTELVDPETGEVRHALLVKREEKNALVIVVSGESGFAGAFNTNILKAGLKQVQALNGKNVDIVALGRKAQESFRRRYGSVPWPEAPTHEQAAEETGQLELTSPDRETPVRVLGEPPAPLEKIQFEDIRRMTQRIVHAFERAEIDSVYLAYNEFKSVIAQRIVVERLLPIVTIGEQNAETAYQPTKEEREAAASAALTAGVDPRGHDGGDISNDGAANKFGTAGVDYIYEQPPAELFAHLLPRYLATQIYHAIVESIAAYHAARMTAMDAASKNASEMVDKLTLTMNRVRQAAITTELTEIVSGAAALTEGQ